MNKQLTIAMLLVATASTAFAGRCSGGSCGVRPRRNAPVKKVASVSKSVNTTESDLIAKTEVAAVAKKIASEMGITDAKLIAKVIFRVQCLDASERTENKIKELLVAWGPKKTVSKPARKPVAKPKPVRKPVVKPAPKMPRDIAKALAKAKLACPKCNRQLASSNLEDLQINACQCVYHLDCIKKMLGEDKQQAPCVKCKNGILTLGSFRPYKEVFKK